MLTILHEVRSPLYKDPMGPLAAGSSVTIRVRLEADQESIDSVRLFYVYGLAPFKESFQRMTALPGQGHFYEAQVRMDGEAGLFFYWFEVRLTDGRYRWGFPDPEKRGLAAQTLVTSPDFKTDGCHPIPGFQITVYEPDFKSPDWMKGAVQYQIFPDRFNRGSDFDESRALALMTWPERIWHQDWEEEVDIEGRGPSGYLACDFFGGRLEGIREKLTYLADMGVTVLYLNPVFKAQSNHRYDTGDYLTVDPLLGDNEDLIRLFKEAGDRGIKVILDGVFSHTGADSLYFNRYDRYDSIGAWQEMRDGSPSAYGSWYRFEGGGDILRYREEGEALPGMEAGEGERPPVLCLDTPGSPDLAYECWWDFPSLPNVHEDDLSYRDFILGPEGVLAHWIRAGAAGFRLDVSDELPDSFLRLLRDRVKKEDPQALIVGEIWEDPTAKISYGHYRDFLFGRTHDSVMGYTFRTAVLDFLKKKSQGRDLALALERILEVTPPEALYAQMNLLGSHDTSRIITELAGQEKPGSRALQAPLRMTAEERVKGERLVLAASLLQLAFPGATAVYYGDEIGMEGYDDPFNRRTFPWQGLEKAKESPFTSKLIELMRLKKDIPVLQTGFFELVHIEEEALVFRRFKKEGKDAFGRVIEGPDQVLIAVNRSDQGCSFPEGSGLPDLEGPGYVMSQGEWLWRS